MKTKNNQAEILFDDGFSIAGNAFEIVVGRENNGQRTVNIDLTKCKIDGGILQRVNLGSLVALYVAGVKIGRFIIQSFECCGLDQKNTIIVSFLLIETCS